VEQTEAAPEIRREASVAVTKVVAGAAPAREPSQGLRPGGVGAPPGDNKVPCQELADM